jgi:hypothetical protein
MEVTLVFESPLDIPDEATIEAEFNCRVESIRVRDSSEDEWEEL